MPRGRKRVKVKIEQSEEQSPQSKELALPRPPSPSQAASPEEESPVESTRRENTLTLLTRRFIELIKSREHWVLDINEATAALGVQKRRIYDITNVLQGIGYIQKIEKNKMRWIGGTRDLDINKEINNLDQQIEDYQEKNHILNEKIMILKEKFNKEVQDKKYLNYFLEEDFREILDKAEGNPKSMMVVLAEEGASLEEREGAIIIEKPATSRESMNYFVISKKEGAEDFHFL